MIYLKSIMAGVVTVLSLTILLFVGIVIHLWVSAYKKQGAKAIGWHPISVIRPGPVLIIVAVFVAGFLWEFSRASR